MNWTYVAKGHYSRPDGKGGTIHVASGAVYVTHPSKATIDIVGARADELTASATGKPVRDSPKREEKSPRAKTPTKKVAAKPAKGAKKSFLTSVKEGAKLTVAAVKPAVTTAVKYGERVAAAGEMVVASTAAADKAATRVPPPASAKAVTKKKTARRATIVTPKKAKKKAKKAKKKATKKLPAKKTVKKTVKKTAKRRAPPVHTVPAHPLGHLLGGAEALPAFARKPAVKRRKEQTLKEFMGGK